MARMVATKAALSIRVDALAEPSEKSEADAPSIGIGHRAKLESRLRALEYQDGSGIRRSGDNGRQQQKFQMTGETKTYNTQADLVPTQRESAMETAIKVVLDVKEEKRRAKEERRAKKKAEKEKAGGSADVDVDADMQMDVDGEEKTEKKGKKEKKRKRRESDVNGEAEEEAPKVRNMGPLSVVHLLTLYS